MSFSRTRYKSGRSISIVAIALLTSASCSKPPKSSEDNYVITEHTVKEHGSENDYTVTYGKVVLKVRYTESQTSSAKPGDTPGSGLHPHSAGEPIQRTPTLARFHRWVRQFADAC
jgi:hypothetical protein